MRPTVKPIECAHKSADSNRAPFHMRWLLVLCLFTVRSAIAYRSCQPRKT